MMFGSVEAISKQGMHKYYFQGGETTCKKNYQYGEDRWLGDCLTEIGVQPVLDERMVGDQLCVRVGVAKDCGDGRAAYHPYKSVGKWMQCWQEAQGQPQWR
mmetsp:Transcript_4509/g.14113  ORF Transcript_4509/g.14113 Transcript_4509/m.14113 type:complete len:101 (+) Transcript_4509:2-304(+)